MNSTVSVVIPTFNRAAQLLAAIRSVDSQTRSADEIIVVDDGSTDDTQSVLTARSLTPGPVPLRTIRQTNSGPAAARNAGLRAARSTLIAFLDDDDLWHPNKMAAQLDLFEADPQLAMVGCASDSFCPTVTATLTNVGIGRLLLRNWFMTSCVVVRREVALDCGGFPEDMRVCEDYALWLRVATRHACAHLDRELVSYGSGKPGYGHSGLSANLAALFTGEREALRRWREATGAGLSTALWANTMAFARHARRLMMISATRSAK